MGILIFILGLVLLCGAIAMPVTKVRWTVILQNFLVVLGMFVMFSGFLLRIGV